MELRAKCLRDVADPSDGERLLVSRIRPRGQARVDGWERRLAPSMRLDFALYRRWITAREYAGLYVADMWSRASVLREIGERARRKPVTIVCICADARRCHRDLVVGMVASLFAAAPTAAAPIARAPATRRAPQRAHAMA